METFSALLAICAGNSPVPGEFPAQRPVTRSFHFFFDLRPNNRLSKQSWGWWFEMLSHPLWRHLMTGSSFLSSANGLLPLQRRHYLNQWRFIVHWPLRKSFGEIWIIHHACKIEAITNSGMWTHMQAKPVSMSHSPETEQDIRSLSDDNL